MIEQRKEKLLISAQEFLSKFPVIKRVASCESEYRVNCPYCNEIGKLSDRKFHLYISLEKNVGYCFRCGKILVFSNSGKTKDFYQVEQKNFIIKGLKEIPKYEEILENSDAFRYLVLKLENYSIEFIKYIIKVFGMKFCIDERFGHLYQRIMIPIKIFGEIVGFQFRSIYGEEPKYYSYGLNNKNIKDYVFNYDNAIKSDEVVIVEGIFDVLPVIEKGVAIFGKNLTKNQLRLLLNSWKRFFICLDGDALRDAIKMGFDLFRNGVEEVYIIDLSKFGKKDPCDLGEKIWEGEIKNIVDFFDKAV